jgi:hypothetical protein
MFGLFKTKVTRHANPPEAMKPRTSALMQERGWTKTSRGWAGPIKTSYGQWPGIVELAGDQVKAYIRYLPAELRQHAQGIGFQQQASGWFRIELALSPVDPDAVICYIERMIVRAGEHNLPRNRHDLAA